MQITSIDNMYEDDGLAGVWTFLKRLNGPPAPGATPQRLIALLPEYRDDGRLDRLDVVTVAADGSGSISADAEILRAAAERIVADQRAKRAAAYAKLDQETIAVIPGP